jgi:predicted alpha/beta hydrolase family esterase
MLETKDINAASNLGEWQEGQEILESLLKLIKETT